MLDGSAAYAAQSGTGTPSPMHTSCDWLFGNPVAVSADANIGSGKVPRNSPTPPRMMYGCAPMPPPAHHQTRSRHHHRDPSATAAPTTASATTESALRNLSADSAAEHPGEAERADSHSPRSETCPCDDQKSCSISGL